MQVTRRLFQVMVMAAVAYLALGYGLRSFEAYCPFGGVEELYAFIQSRTATCALGPWNLGALAALLLLTLLAKKAFCSWVCPVGFLMDLLGQVQQRLFRRRELVPTAVDRGLRGLRWVVLAAVLYPTWKTGELAFRGYDPFYLLASGLGHGAVGWISGAVLVGVLALGLVIRQAWCRYLCPLSAVMDGFSALSPVALHRSQSACRSCGKCDRVCAQGLKPSQRAWVSHVDCSNCLECASSCPEEGALVLEIRRPFQREPA